MGALHEWLAILALAVAVVCLAVATASWASGRSARILLDRLILLELGALLPTIAVGALMGVLEGLPRDPLHLVYGIAVLFPLPAARYLGRSGPLRRRAGWIALGALTTAALIVRLFQTGG